MKGKKEKIDTFKITVDQLVEAFGGINNILEAFNCATRFRVVVKDENLVSKDKLQSVDKAKGFSKEGDQWQVIFGAGIVNKVFDKYQSLYIIDGQKTFEPKKKKIWNKNYSFRVNFFSVSRNAIRNFADIFIPLIPIFVAAGLSLALKSLIDAAVAKNTTPASIIITKIFDVIGGGILGSLPVLIGYTSAKKWGGNPWFGAAMGLILVSPGLFNVYGLNVDPSKIVWTPLWEMNNVPDDGRTYIPILIDWGNNPSLFAIKYPVFSIPLIGYQAQVVPTLLVVLVMVQIEKLLKKISHESIAIITVPLFTILISTLLAFSIIGPIGYVISLSLGEAFKAIFIYTNFPYFGFGGMILGFFYPLIVVTGLHQGFLPIEATLIAQDKITWITPIACVSNISQGIACLTSLIFIRDAKTRGVATSGGISANLGITEPALFGINVNIRHLLLAGMIGSMFGGYWLGMTQTVANTFGSASWLGLVQFSFTQTENVSNWYAHVANSTPWGSHMNGFGLAAGFNAIIAMVISTIVTFIAAFFLSLGKNGITNYSKINKDIENYKYIVKLQLWFSNLETKTKNVFYKIIYMNNYEQKMIQKKTSYIYSPIDGELIDLKEIDDVTFKDELLGKTFCIKPYDDKYDLYSPLKGEITNIFDTGHAISITNKNNNTLLIHIGLETAQINTDAKDLKHLKCFKFKKFILSKVNKNSNIVKVESSNLLLNKAKDNKVYCALLNESIKENQTINLVAKYGSIKKGEPIFEIVNK